jgi:steroid delta-isomerase
MTERQSRDHVDRFNAAVGSGDWAGFVTGFAPDAVMTFVGPPVGPFVGRAAIADAYATDPPDDTMDLLSVRELPGEPADIVAFRWTRGGTGTMTIRRRDGLVTSLTVTFD